MTPTLTPTLTLSLSPSPSLSLSLSLSLPLISLSLTPWSEQIGGLADHVDRAIKVISNGSPPIY